MLVRPRTLLAAFAVALAVTIVAGAAVRPNGDLLVLRSWQSGYSGSPLAVVAPDGRVVRELLPPEWDVRYAAFSPDGRRIAFSGTAPPDLDPEIYVIGVDGSGLQKLTDNHLADLGPAWSPDGRSLAFASARTGLFQIYRMRADGSGQRRLTNQFEDCSNPAWSPTNAWIVAECELGWPTLVRMRPDGRGQRRILRSPYRTADVDPDWSPDGKWIVFGRGGPGAPLQGVHMVRPDGTGLRRIHPRGGEPTFSPDGRSVAFVHFDGTTQDLWVLPLGGSATKVHSLRGARVYAPDWAPR